MKAKKIVILAAAGVAVFYAITQPNEAAGAVHTIVGWLREGADAIIVFFHEVFA